MANNTVGMIKYTNKEHINKDTAIVIYAIKTGRTVLAMSFVLSFTTMFAPPWNAHSVAKTMKAVPVR
jgi:hypothetical protein